MDSAATPGKKHAASPADLPLQSILDGIGEAVGLLDRDWRFVYVNAHAENLAGMPEEDLLGQPIWTLFPGAVAADFEGAANSPVGRTINLEHYVPGADSWYEIRFYPTPRGLLLFASDITERKRLDQQVQDSERRYQNLFEIIHDGILIIDDEGRFVDVNESFCGMLKVTRDRLIGAHFSDYISREKLGDARAAFADLKTGKSTPTEFPFRAGDDSVVLLEWSSCAHYLPGLFFCICRDRTEKRRAEAALRASEERQRRAVEAGRVGLWEWDIAGNRVTWSDYIYELHGIPPGSFDGTVESFTALVDPRDRERVSAAIERTLSGHGDYQVEFRAVRPDGKPRWLQTSGKVTFSADGKPVALHGAVLDTTARCEAEEAHRIIEGQLMMLVEASGTLLASPQSAEVLRSIVQLAQRFVSADAHAVWRRRADNTWGLRSSSGLSAEFVATGSTGPAASIPAAPMLFEDIAIESRLSLRQEALVREGVRSMLAIPLQIHGEASGTVVFYWKHAHRITDLEIRIATALGNLAAAALGTAELYERELELRGEAELAAGKAAFLSEAGALLSSSLDFEATLASVANLAVPIFADMVSVDVQDAAGKIRRLAFAHRDPDKVEFFAELARRYPAREDDAIQQAIQTARSILLEEISDEGLQRRAQDAEHLRQLREMEISSVILAPMVSNGKALGVLTFVTSDSRRRYTSADLQTAEELARRAAAALENARLYKEAKQSQTELRAINEEFRRANDDLNQFAYSASHDLQEPLRMVSIYSQLMRRKYADRLDATADQYLSYTVEGASRMEALLRDILIYTQTASSADGTHQPLDANEVLEKALANLAGAIAETGAQVTHGDLPVLRVQEIHLLQIFQNLIGNALKYRSQSFPRVEIKATLHENAWLFSVKDNGIGIEPQYNEQIFGLFKRLHSAEDYPGTGVGLAICQKIVERYRGRIWVESGAGAGSTFYFTLAA